jgi:hypothetical protein
VICLRRRTGKVLRMAVVDPVAEGRREFKTQQKNRAGRFQQGRGPLCFSRFFDRERSFFPRAGKIETT